MFRAVAQFTGSERRAGFAASSGNAIVAQSGADPIARAAAWVGRSALGSDVRRARLQKECLADETAGKFVAGVGEGCEAGEQFCVAGAAAGDWWIAADAGTERECSGLRAASMGFIVARSGEFQ